MTTQEYFGDHRLAGLYDRLNAGRDDIEFYLELAEEIGATTIVDIGCGTGLLATELAARGHRVIGVDPSESMLAVARGRPGHELVTWMDGDASAVPDVAADLAIMTGHVAQVFLDDAAWTQLLSAVHRALAPGGRLAFESRAPAAQAWFDWNSTDSFRRVDGGDQGPVEVWQEVTGVHGDLVSFDEHHRFLATGADVVYGNTLRFPQLDLLTESLAEAAFTVESVFGDWDRSDVTESSPEFIIVAGKAWGAQTRLPT